ncbi:MAG: hypothetical protein WC236_09185 [Gallionellaceae bacterium]
MDSVLKEVRFRMVAVPLDQISIKGSRDQLTEARARVPQIWGEFKGKLEHVQLEKDNRDLVDKIDTQVTLIDAFFLKISTHQQFCVFYMLNYL